MLKWLLDKVIWDKSVRFQMTILYAMIFSGLSVYGKIEPISFGTFSGILGAWIISETTRKVK